MTNTVRRLLVSATILTLLSGCARDDAPAGVEPGGYTAAANLESFCDRLPRPAWAAFEKHPASNDWFEVYAIEPGIWAIYEPHQWQEVISYLIVGTESAVLFDTGNGIGDMRAVVDQLTDKPVRVINSHSHYDHVGGNYRFDEVLSLSMPFSLERAAGLESEELLAEVSPEALCRPLPDGVTAENHRIRPYTITASIAHGDVIDIGGRTLEILHIPGHTPDAIALLDREAGFLWSGDSFYEGPVWLFAPETDIVSYRGSVKRLAALAPELTAVFPAHNTPRADPELLVRLNEALGAVMAGDVEPETVGEGQVEFGFEGFSLLLREDLLPAE